MFWLGTRMAFQLDDNDSESEEEYTSEDSSSDASDMIL